jgi:SAM-dependent methyltransferase
MFSNASTPSSPDSLLVQLSLSPYVLQALNTITQLNIPDRLADGPKTAEELAQETRLHARSLYRILSFLASFNALAQDEQGAFSLTPLSDTLRTDHPHSLHDWLLFTNESWRWDVARAMMQVASTGKNAYDTLYQKKNIYQAFTDHPEWGQFFNIAMKSLSSSLPDAVVETYDFSSAQTVVDLGAGMGDLIATILKANPTVQGILFDLPHIVPESQKFLENHGVADRCQVVGGNFLESVPEGGNIYIISFLLMDWTDEDCITIMKNCHRAMVPGGKLLIIEPILEAERSRPFANFMDIIMLMETSGVVRTEEQWKELVQAAGFAEPDFKPTGALGFDVIESQKTSEQ